MSGWRSLWRFEVLAASILSSCFLLTEGQGTISPVKIVLQPPHPAVGQNVALTPTLTPGDLVEKALLCNWYRGLTTVQYKLIFSTPPKPEQNNGPTFTGRETGGPGCSLHIRNLTSEDTGNYTVTVFAPGENLKGQASLVVSEKLSSPVLRPSEVMVVENFNVTLKCNTSNSPGVSVSWFKDNKPFLSGLSDRNRILTLIRVTRNDNGLYTCEASNSVSSTKSNPANITVAYRLLPDLVPSNVSIAPGIIVGSLAVTALVVGTLLYVFFCARGRRNKASTQTAAAPSVYENVSPSRQVKIDGSADSSNIYQGKLYRSKFPPLPSSHKDTGALSSSSSGHLRVLYDVAFPDSMQRKPRFSSPHETLQHADQSVYQQLEGSRQVSQPVSLS